MDVERLRFTDWDQSLQAWSEVDGALGGVSELLRGDSDGDVCTASLPSC